MRPVQAVREKVPRIARNRIPQTTDTWQTVVNQRKQQFADGSCLQSAPQRRECDNGRDSLPLQSSVCRGRPQVRRQWPVQCEIGRARFRGLRRKKPLMHACTVRFARGVCAQESAFLVPPSWRCSNLSRGWAQCRCAVGMQQCICSSSEHSRATGTAGFTAGASINAQTAVPSITALKKKLSTMTRTAAPRSAAFEPEHTDSLGLQICLSPSRLSIRISRRKHGCLQGAALLPLAHQQLAPPVLLCFIVVLLSSNRDLISALARSTSCDPSPGGPTAASA